MTTPQRTPTGRPIAVARTARFDSPADVARPFVWIAAIAFTAGFWGYLALSPLLGR
jgi:hypothetical protein